MSFVKTIVVATDFSKHSAAAIDWAADLARRYSASLNVVHVVQPFVPYAPGFGTYVPADVDQIALGEAKKTLDEIRSRVEALGATEVSTEVVQGTPGQQIIEQVAAKHADLLVVGTHGHTGLKHLLLGSTAEKLVRTAPCPVLTVHAAA